MPRATSLPFQDAGNHASAVMADKLDVFTTNWTLHSSTLTLALVEHVPSVSTVEASVMYVVDKIVVFKEEKSVEARVSQAADRSSLLLVLLCLACGNASTESTSCVNTRCLRRPMTL